MAQTVETVWRDFQTSGVPGSGVHQPHKREIRELLSPMEAAINSFLASGGLIFATAGALNADLNHAANSMAWVILDSAVANNGIYQKQGALGGGSWLRVADLPYTFVKARDDGDGTANAIIATSTLPIHNDVLVACNVFRDNTGTPVSVRFNGGPVLTVKTPSGNDIAAGGLLADMIMLGYQQSTIFRLLSDPASAANAAAAEAAQAAAEEARDLAIAAADQAAVEGAGDVPMMPSRAFAIASTIPTERTYVQLAGYSAPGDGGRALYKKVGTEPSHPGKFQSVDGAWWEIAESVLHTAMFGGAAVPASIQSAIDALPANGGTVIVSPGVYAITTSIVIGNGTEFAVSTRNGVRLIGSALPPIYDYALAGTEPPTKLVWAGAAGGIIIDVRGPIRGIEVSNLFLDGASSADCAFKAISMSNFRTDFLTITACRVNHYWLTCHPITVTSSNTELGSVNSLFILMGNVTNAIGILCDGSTDGSASTCFVDFFHTRIGPSSTHATLGIVLRVADTVLFYDTLIIPAASVIGTYGIIYDYSKHNTFPACCIFNQIDVVGSIPPANQFAIFGSPGLTRPNYISNLTEINGCRYPTTIANLQVDLPKKVLPETVVLGASTALGFTYLIVAQNAGFYRINYYMVVSAAAAAGTIRGVISFNDGASPQNVFLPAVDANAVGSFTSGSLLITAAADSPIAYSTQFSGVSGTPNYSFLLVAERLS